MMHPGQLLAVFLIYPGLLTAVILGISYGVLRDGKSRTLTQLRSMVRPIVWTSVEGVLLLLSIVLAAIGLAYFPLPLHPFPTGPSGWLLAWAFLEVAWMFPVTPSLLTGSPMVVRAASREIQIGAAGRALLWMLLATGLVLQHHQSTIETIPAGIARLIIAITTLITLPVAMGWGPFAFHTSMMPGGSWQGFPPDLLAVAQLAHAIRTAVLVAASLGTTLPLPRTGFGFLLLLVAFVVYAMVLHRLDGRWPRYALSDALRSISWKIFPLCIVTFFMLMLMT